MLREVPGYTSPNPSISSPITMTEPIDHFEPRADALDDIFGSAPNSPTHRPTTTNTTNNSTANGAANENPQEEEDPEIDFSALNPLPVQNTANTERSDIPRLRSTHVTNGYRDGIAESKAQYVQEGFDEGFSLGAVLGLRAGWLLGAFEGVVRAVSSGGGGSGGRDGNDGVGEEVSRELAGEWALVKTELDLLSLFGREFFGPDGIWKFEVEGEDEGGEVTFQEVADAHPLIGKWRESLLVLEERFGLDLKKRGAEEKFAEGAEL